MGCVASTIDKDERVRVCKERKRLMRQLLGFRGEFADAQLAYLRALKNSGLTLRQFVESESLELEDNPYGPALPPSPPPPSPPSPPPPPEFSPDSRKFVDNQKVEAAKEEIIELADNSSCTPPPPPVSSSSWEFWDPFDTSPMYEKNTENMEQDDEENWAEANTEFEEEDQEAEAATGILNLHPEEQQITELVDNNLSMMSWHNKDTADSAMVVRRNKKTLAGIIKELDDYFLKASAGGKDVAVVMNINTGDTFFTQSINENKSKYILPIH